MCSDRGPGPGVAGATAVQRATPTGVSVGTGVAEVAGLDAEPLGADELGPPAVVEGDGDPVEAGSFTNDRSSAITTTTATTAVTAKTGRDGAGRIGRATTPS